MQFLDILAAGTLPELVDLAGRSRAMDICTVNRLPYTFDIKSAYDELVQSTVQTVTDVPISRKLNVLNTLVDSYEVFQHAALLDDIGWKVLSAISTFPGYLKIPDNFSITPSQYTLGPSNNKVSTRLLKEVRGYISSGAPVDPAVFKDRSASRQLTGLQTNARPLSLFDRSFNIPWGEVTLFSEIDGTSIDFPVYPEEISDTHQANYTTMPDILYQYEPWQLYESSGPRTVPYTFEFHRDMWTGDHRDGKANELIRFCEACCYARYNGSEVNTTVVTLYVHGSPLIRGIVTNVSKTFSGPLGLDGMPLHCKLELNITEVSKNALNYDVVKAKPLIG